MQTNVNEGNTPTSDTSVSMKETAGDTAMGTKPKRRSLCRVFVRVLYVFQVATQLHVSLRYLIPVVFENYDPTVQYYMKVLMCYILIMGAANWLSIVLITCEYRPTKDRPEPDMQYLHRDTLPERFHDLGRQNKTLGNVHSEVRITNQSTRHQKGENGDQNKDDVSENSAQDRAKENFGDQTELNVAENGALPWRYCKTCDMHIPPRTHHCKFCQKCIMRLDHHCHMVGHCIGHWNQRYFVVLSVYTSLACLLGLFLTTTFLIYHHSSFGVSAWVYFPPCWIWKVVTLSIHPLHALLVFHIYMEIGFGVFACIYTYGQFKFIARGKTIYEVAKEKKFKVTTPRSKNFQLVFGDHWWLNFIFPAQIIFKQTCDGLQYDGIKAE